MKNVLIVLSIIVLAVASCKTKNKTKSIRVFAAAGLTDVMAEIVDSFEGEYNIKVKTNIASSGILARQIEQGAPADIYISASKKWSDYVDNLGIRKSNQKQEIASNKLVLIVPISREIQCVTIDSVLNFKYLLKDGRVSMGDPAHVPAGKYAQQALNYYGWYKSIKPQILPAKDVRSALMVVEMNEVQLGIVYKTDASKSSKVKILGQFSEESHEPIKIIASMMNEGEETQKFYKYLLSDKVKNILKKSGFSN